RNVPVDVRQHLAALGHGGRPVTVSDIAVLNQGGGCVDDGRGRGGGADDLAAGLDDAEHKDPLRLVPADLDTAGVVAGGLVGGDLDGGGGHWLLLSTLLMPAYQQS